MKLYYDIDRCIICNKLATHHFNLENFNNPDHDIFTGNYDLCESCFIEHIQFRATETLHFEEYATGEWTNEDYEKFVRIINEAAEKLNKN
jgi:hypothetical protein